MKSMKSGRIRTKSLNFLFALKAAAFTTGILCSAFVLGCSKTGNIEGIAGSSACHSEGDEIVLWVRLDDGRKVNAGRGKDNNGGRITGGQRVKLKQVASAESGEDCWEIVQWLD
jgi:hypothetical protein